MKNKKIDKRRFSTSKNLWKRAKKSIAGGNHLISKNPEMLCPDIWPTYYKNAKGVHTTGVNKIKYLDFYLMGVGTSILGYANKTINQKVIKTITEGSVSSLNCYEEVKLAEYLLKINKWANKVRFARTGGEANSIAVRLARASCKSDKQKIAICGYHGWHDWYLAANLKKSNNLDNLLIPNIPSDGVPKNLKNTIVKFEFNDIQNLKKVLKLNKDIGIIKLEVYRNDPPDKNFLQELRQICNDKKIILIFDECTSGFRETFGGIHQKYNINPDLIIYGKALGNGFPITAIIGKDEILNNISKTFISSTFWSERIGPTAALATLSEMERLRSWEKISKYGLKIKRLWKKLSDYYELKIIIGGVASIPQFYIPSKKFLKYKTYITQEFLKNDMLAGNLVFVSTCHDNQMMKKYEKILNSIFEKIRDFEDGENIDNYLIGPEIKNYFRNYSQTIKR